MRHIGLEDRERLVSIDVKSLFTRVPEVSLIARLDSSLEHGTGMWDWII